MAVRAALTTFLCVLFHYSLLGKGQRRGGSDGHVQSWYSGDSSVLFRDFGKHRPLRKVAPFSYVGKKSRQGSSFGMEVDGGIEGGWTTERIAVTEGSVPVV